MESVSVSDPQNKLMKKTMKPAIAASVLQRNGCDFIRTGLAASVAIAASRAASLGAQEPTAVSAAASGKLPPLPFNPRTAAHCSPGALFPALGTGGVNRIYQCLTE